MSSRFHNKFHRHNHHTLAINDPRYPDASHDPIASPDSPFLGDFVLVGTLSAMPPPALSGSSTLFGKPGAIIYGTPVAAQVEGNMAVTGSISAANINFTGNTITTYTDPSTTGTFLEVIVNGVTYGIRLWQA